MVKHRDAVSPPLNALSDNRYHIHQTNTIEHPPCARHQGWIWDARIHGSKQLRVQGWEKAGKQGGNRVRQLPQRWKWTDLLGSTRGAHAEAASEDAPQRMQPQNSALFSPTVFLPFRASCSICFLSNLLPTIPFFVSIQSADVLLTVKSTYC